MKGLPGHGESMSHPGQPGVCSDQLGGSLGLTGIGTEGACSVSAEAGLEAAAPLARLPCCEYVVQLTRMKGGQ